MKPEDDNEAVRAIDFAIEIDDHYDRLEFLKAWRCGDLSEWPDFRSALPHAYIQRNAP